MLKRLIILLSIARNIVQIRHDFCPPDLLELSAILFAIILSNFDCFTLMLPVISYERFWFKKWSFVYKVSSSYLSSQSQTPWAAST